MITAKGIGPDAPSHRAKTMTITITALTNDRAQLIVKKAVFHNDERMADIVLGAWEAEGFKVLKHEEN